MGLKELYRRRLIVGTVINPPSPTGDYVPFIISHWKYNGNALDSIGNNHGVATSVTYPIVNGIQMADFSAFTSAGIEIPDAANLSFGNGTSDVDFSLDFILYFNTINNCWMVNKRNDSGANMEYNFHYYSNYFQFALIDSSNSAYRYKNYTFTPSIGVIYHFGFTYISEILRIYKNGVDVGGTQLEAGTYVAMENLSEPLRVGKSNKETSSLNGKIGVQTFWNKGLTPSEMLDVATKKLNGTPIF